MKIKKEIKIELSGDDDGERYTGKSEWHIYQTPNPNHMTEHDFEIVLYEMRNVYEDIQKKHEQLKADNKNLKNEIEDMCGESK